jgi:Glycosyl hydrolase family 12
VLKGSWSPGVDGLGPGLLMALGLMGLGLHAVSCASGSDESPGSAGVSVATESSVPPGPLAPPPSPSATVSAGPSSTGNTGASSPVTSEVDATSTPATEPAVTPEPQTSQAPPGITSPGAQTLQPSAGSSTPPENSALGGAGNIPPSSSVSTGGSVSTGSSAVASGGAAGAPGGAGGAGATVLPATGELGNGVMVGSGSSDDRYANDDVQRSGQNYRFIANGWGPGFQSQAVSWSGTSFIVESMEGSQGDNYEPASYPTMFCGRYSDSQSQQCGLPAALTSLTSVKTGWRWNPNANAGEYNAAYDIWIGTDSGEAGGGFGGFGRSGLQGYLMVWLRDPPGQQPAGMLTHEGVTDILGLPGTWDIWTGTVNSLPITNYVRQEDSDLLELEFDVMDVIADATARDIMLPGDTLLSVAVGFEIWNGPVTNLSSEDFYVNVE